MTTYLSQVLDRPVWDAQGRRVGRCKDLLVQETERGYPPLQAMAIVQPGGEEAFVPASEIAWLTPSIILKSASVVPYSPRGNELWLKQQVLDRQIVDTEGRRLVRVNDLQLARVPTDGRYHLMGVDVGTASLVRRLGVEAISARLLGLFGREPAERLIPWQEVASVEVDAPIRLKVTQDRIREIHPVDIADIVSELDRPTAMALLETMDTETAADTLQEVDPELQTTMLTAMDPERAADVLEEMDPDDAADLLATLEEEDRTNLLELMEEEDSAQVETLLSYPVDSAGGIMTTEFATIPAGLRVGQALDYLRTSPKAREDEALYYLHIVDGQGRLKGIVTLRDLVLSDPAAPVDDIMEDHPITVEPTTPQREVARLVAKYNVLAIPVVDTEEVLVGIVTVDDAIDAIIPTAWKKHLPHIY